MGQSDLLRYVVERLESMKLRPGTEALGVKMDTWPSERLEAGV